MSSRAVVLSIILLAAGAVLACLLQLPLIWDGGSQLVVTLIEQKPFVYLTRCHTWFAWWPLVWLSRVTESQSALLLAYGLPFLLAPAASVAASWWFVRSNAPRLAVWSAFGVAASLPGQAFVINDSIWQQTLAWPLILGALVPLTGTQRLVWIAFGICQLPHQVGVLFIGMAFLSAWIAGQCWARRAALVLLCLAAMKAIWVSIPSWSGPLFDSYAAQEASRGRLWQTFRTSVVGWVLAGLVPLWAAAACVLFAPRACRWTAALLGLTAIAWIVYATVPGEWISAINYRRWVMPVGAPFVLAAIWDSRRVRSIDSGSTVRNIALVALAALYLVVIGLQSITFHRLLGRLRSEAEAQAGPIVTGADLPSVRGTVLDHWSLTATFMFLQGRTPAQYLAVRQEDVESWNANPPVVSLHAGASYPISPGRAGWFDHRPLADRLRKGR